MSVKQMRQDRRNRESKRDVVTHHAGLKSVGHSKGQDNGETADKTILSRDNGAALQGRGNPSPEGASAPGSNGPAESDATASNITATF